MIVNFNESEAIITYDGLQIVIQGDKAIELANRILDYFEEDLGGEFEEDVGGENE